MGYSAHLQGRHALFDIVVGYVPVSKREVSFLAPDYFIPSGRRVGNQELGE